MLLSCLLSSSAVFAEQPIFPGENLVSGSEFCAEDMNRMQLATVQSSASTFEETPTPKVTFLEDLAVVLEYPSIYDVHTPIDPNEPLRSQPGSFHVQSILGHLEALVDAPIYDFVLMYSTIELPGWIHSGGRWNGAPAKNIGLRNSDHGGGITPGNWTSLRGTPHMNALDIYADFELFPGSDGATLVPIHEIGHYWMVYWNRGSEGPRNWRPGDPVAHLAGASAHWSWNWIDTIAGPEDMPGIMYSGPLSYRFNEFDLYAMGLLGYPELSGVSHQIYECAPPDYEACIPGTRHDLGAQHLLESLDLEGPDYHEGDGQRIPAVDDSIHQLNALLVIIAEEGEPLSGQQESTIRRIAGDLPGAWSTATWGLSQLSISAQTGEFWLNAGLNGNWWNGPARNGEGVQIEVADAGDGNLVFVATVYAYDTMGNQIFLVAVGPVAGNRTEVEVFITEGGMWGDDFDPDRVSEIEWGTGVFTASSCDAMHMVLMPNVEFQAEGYTDLEYDLVRLTTPMIACPTGYPNR